MDPDRFALTTHWNAWRHTAGEAMVEEILAMGFRSVELGYDLRLDLVAGVKKMVEQKAVRVVSLHNFCPVPIGAPRGHPELFTFADPDDRVRRKAVETTARTVRFAAEVGAGAVVVHAGNADMRQLSVKLFDLLAENRQGERKYERIWTKLQRRREKRARRQVEWIHQCVEQMLPVLEECRVILAFENLPTWEAYPTELEMADLLQKFQSPWIGCWHDTGHGQIRENAFFTNPVRCLERVLPRLAGMHVHDVRPPAEDHVMPPGGMMDFSRYRDILNRAPRRVLEPSRACKPEEIVRAVDHLSGVMDGREAAAGPADGGGRMDFKEGQREERL